MRLTPRWRNRDQEGDRRTSSRIFSDDRQSNGDTVIVAEFGMANPTGCWTLRARAGSQYRFLPDSRSIYLYSSMAGLRLAPSPAELDGIPDDVGPQRGQTFPVADIEGKLDARCGGRCSVGANHEQRGAGRSSRQGFCITEGWRKSCR